MTRRDTGTMLTLVFGLFACYCTVGPLVDGNPEVGPPMPITVLLGVAALAILGCGIAARRGNAAASRISAAFIAIVVFLVAPVPFIPDVPQFDKLVIGVGILVGIAAVVLSFRPTGSRVSN